MDNYDFAGKRILVASILPDTGHLTPLLQIAEALKERGADVYAVAPIEAKNLISQYSVDARYLGPVIPEAGKLALSEYSKAGEFSRLFFRGPLFSQKYIIPLTANGVVRLDELVDKALRYSPHLIIADNHLFSSEYRELAHRCNCQLMLNHSKGSHFSCQDEHVWSGGRSVLSLRFRAWARSVASPLHYKLSKLFFRDRLAHTQSLIRFIKRTRGEHEYHSRADNSFFSTAIGTADIEKKYLGKLINLLPAETRIYGPIDPGDQWGKDEDLRKWLDASGGTPVVYVAFGTMVTPSEKTLRKLVNTLDKKGARVLLATRECPSFLADSKSTGSILWKPWVPQPAVLSHPAVVAFASHAGATSMQETLWYGKPILCLPVLWDQFYLSWFAEQVGFGVWADGMGFRRLPLEDRVERLLSDDSLREKAENLSKELRKQAGLEAIIQDIYFWLFGDDGEHDKEVHSL